MFYPYNNTKSCNSDSIRRFNERLFDVKELGFQTTGYIGDNSGCDGIKEFYFEYSDQNIDTLFVNY